MERTGSRPRARRRNGAVEEGEDDVEEACDEREEGVEENGKPVMYENSAAAAWAMQREGLTRC